MNVTVDLAKPEQKPVLRGLLACYLHDLSEFDGREFSEFGEFVFPELDHYWLEHDDRFPILIRADGQLAGFALVKKCDAAWSMADFFVLRKFRRQKVGAAAALKIIPGFVGPWAVTSDKLNDPARTFWQRIIRTQTRDAYTEVANGTQISWRFVVEE
ncbi:MAG: GNAT family N-acetyltransferase [Dehalococcoidia bacterium]